MTKKNKGWDYINSDDLGSMSDEDEDDVIKHSDGSGSYYGADGSWGYSNSDGSGSYYGADGSWGSKNSDGSASYYGEDGSWGYRNSDGSGSYYGADGSWGYKNSDGSASYYGADGSYNHKEANYENEDDDDDDDDDDDEDDDSSFSESIESMLNAYKAVKEIKAEERRMEEERAEAEKREKRKAWRRKHRKGIVVSTIICIVFLLGTVGIFEYQKLTPMRYSNSSLEGIKYTEVVQKLKESGFSNVHTKEISDLTISREDEENLVTKINLLFWGNSFGENTKYPSNMWIGVVYHTVELYSPPLTSKEINGMNYLDVIQEFEDTGFSNIQTNVKYDIITGWLTDDGEVSSVTINGDKKFDSSDKYRLDAEVIITYHTLASNKPK